jgi:hypothetical protein
MSENLTVIHLSSAREVYNDTNEDMTSGDVQKKMMPWRVMLPETELDADLLEDYNRKQHKAGGMVLVTSLVDKIPNLGGNYSRIFCFVLYYKQNCMVQMYLGCTNYHYQSACFYRVRCIECLTM